MMGNTAKLSVVLAVHNEEACLARCLESVKNTAQEIVVVDGDSKDDSVKIALRFGAVVIKTTNKPIFHINKQMAIDAAQGDWILQMDADEVVDDELIESITTILKQNSPYNAYRLKRKNYFLGSFLTKGGQYPDCVIRLFKRGKAFLPQLSVHEQMKVEGGVGDLQGHLLHYNAPTFSRYLTNSDRYTSLTAQEMHTDNVPLNMRNDIYYLLVKPMYIFLTLFIRHRGYVDGFPGFIFAFFSGLHVATAYMKLKDLYEHPHR
jgi:glycosyltransferase involved in cell wall biosynthesis